MNTNSNTYTFIYASIMVIIVAAVLSLISVNLKPLQDKNIEIEKKRNILASVAIESNAENAEELFAEKIVNTYIVNSNGEKLDGNAFIVDIKKEHAKPLAEQNLPVFECDIEGSTKYIIPLLGSGLWGPIWGYISFDDDMNSIYGANFDHKGETPGLGAEISTDMFEKPFKGKNIFDQDGKFVSIFVAKASESAPELHKVDAISGGTITSKGLEKMLFNDLSAYEAFFSLKRNRE